MTKKFYESKVTYKVFDDERGKDVKVKETYIIEAASYGDAEEQTYELLKQVRADSPSEPKISPVKILDVINNTGESSTDDDNQWYRVKVTMIVPETEKTVRGQLLVKAKSLEQALTTTRDTYKNGVTDVTANGVLDSDVFIVQTLEK